MRAGNFSSSEIWKLTKSGRGKNDYFGSPALTYIEEKRWERKLGRSLTGEINAKPTTWGTFLESIAYEKLDISFSLVSKQRFYHKTVPNWNGMPDAINEDVVGDIKCPYTLREFCKLVDAIKSDNPGEQLKATKEEYYWQLVSNGILCEKDYASLFVYVPYKEELDDIREQASNSPDSNKVAFINWAQDSELPYLLKEGQYKSFNACVFEIPKEDKEFLTERVIKANELL